MPEQHAQVPLNFTEFPSTEMERRACEFDRMMQRRRTVRQFSRRAVSSEVIHHCVSAAGSAPSGANQQPWHFAIVQDGDLKRRIRMAAEKEEREFYAGGLSREWVEAVRPLGTDSNKPFLEEAPYLIVIFAERYRTNRERAIEKNYYVNESVGIAIGILITALHQSGLATLTHTPAPMQFLNSILGRPNNERPFLILVVGYPDESATVPDIRRKEFEQICSWH